MPQPPDGGGTDGQTAVLDNIHDRTRDIGFGVLGYLAHRIEGDPRITDGDFSC